MYRRLTALLVLGTPLVFGDITLRYESDFKSRIALPGDSAGRTPGFRINVIRIKGDKTQSTMGALTVIGNLATGQMTWIDSQNMRFATGTMGDFSKALADRLAADKPSPALDTPSLVKMFQGDVQIRKTGRTRTIQGILTEETELEYSMRINPPAPNASGSVPAMRMAMQVWAAPSGEIARTPELAELARYSAALNRAGTFDISDLLRRLSSTMASFDQRFTALQDALQELLQQSGLPVQMRMEETSFLFGGAAPQRPAQDQAAPGDFDSRGLLMSMTTELMSVSTAPIDESIFEVPSDYRKVELDEILED